MGRPALFPIAFLLTFGVAAIALLAIGCDQLAAGLATDKPVSPVPWVHLICQPGDAGERVPADVKDRTDDGHQLHTVSVIIIDHLHSERGNMSAKPYMTASSAHGDSQAALKCSNSDGPS